LYANLYLALRAFFTREKNVHAIIIPIPINIVTKKQGLKLHQRMNEQFSVLKKVSERVCQFPSKEKFPQNTFLKGEIFFTIIS
jgi:hypothetical protein